MATIIGTAGDDKLSGPDGQNNQFDLTAGGHDTVQGGDRSDFITLDDSFERGDRLDGGAGVDDVFLDGDSYGHFRITGQMLRNFEGLYLEGGHSYGIAMDDAAVGDEAFSVRSDLFTASDRLRFDGSRETTGTFQFVLREGIYDLRGSQVGNDFECLTHLDASDRLIGGKGYDILSLQEDGRVKYDFNGPGPTLRKMDFVGLWRGDFHLVMADADLSGAKQMTIGGSTAHSLFFDASAELHGRYVVSGSSESDTLVGGRADDTFAGGAGDDRIIGGQGRDNLIGQAGADTFVYRDVSESYHHHADLIGDLESGDIINLAEIDAVVGKAGNQAFHLTDHLSGQAGELVLSYNASADLTTLSGDVDGDGRADLEIILSGDHIAFAGIVF